MTVKEYIDDLGVSPFACWFSGLHAQAAARVMTALSRMELGNLSNAKSVGSGAFEYRIDFGPGYRIYFGMDGRKLILLLGGGTKKRQSKDIAEAQRLWQEYKERKRKGE